MFFHKAEACQKARSRGSGECRGKFAVHCYLLAYRAVEALRGLPEDLIAVVLHGISSNASLKSTQHPAFCISQGQCIQKPCLEQYLNRSR
jgi:hypothetical protein